MKGLALRIGSIFCTIILIGGGYLAVDSIRASRVDHSNYTVNPEVTRQVIALFDSLGNKPTELVMAGSAKPKAVGATGMGTVSQFAVVERGDMLGLHCLEDRGRTVIRFSFLHDGHSPFSATDLSASLVDDEALRISFGTFLKRLAAADPNCRRAIIQAVSGGKVLSAADLEAMK